MKFTGKLSLFILSIAMLASVGCDRSNDMLEDPQAEGVTEAETASETDSAGGIQGPVDDEFTPALPSQETVLDDSALDDEGRIVLLGEDVGDNAADDETPAVDMAVSEKTELDLVLDEYSLPKKTPADTVSTDVIIEKVERPADAVSGVPTPAGTAASIDPARKEKKQLPVEANVATESERNQVIAKDWPKPDVVLFVSGQQHGYMEPCGCTGLENQKGGVIRRDTLLSSLAERGWDLLPVDVGNQVRRIGRQAEIKFASTVTALKKMDYAAVTLGVDDLKLSSIELIQAAAEDETFILTNVTVLDDSFFPKYRVVEAGGRRIGIVSALGREHAKKVESDDIQVTDPLSALPPVLKDLRGDGVDFVVLLAHASLEESREVAQKVAGIDLVVTAGGFGEPTLMPEEIENSKAQMVQVGTKGMYGGIVGLFDDEKTPVRYQKIAISSQFKDSKRMLEHFASYQKQLEQIGFSGLGLDPIPHPSGRKFVGSETCGDCHTSAFEIWEDTPHHHATESVVNPPNDRGGIQRHFDPECISCHATGWNVRDGYYYPYETGYIELTKSAAMHGSGCENCHGPGAEHAAAEYGDIDLDNDAIEKLREQMKMPLERAEARCLQCHDLDNSPDFSFDEYWERVKHYGKE